MPAPLSSRIDPGPCAWDLPDPRDAPDGEELLAAGADLAPATLLAAYSSGLFPMPLEAGGPMGWWSPDPRGVLPLERLAKAPLFGMQIDSAFADVVEGCADPRRPHGWIDPAIATAYAELHRLGWAHSIEVRDDEGALVGGLYGLEIGGLFAGESMFSRVTDASKVAVVALVERLRQGSAPDRRLLDVQWRTDHLATLGVVDVARAAYLDLLDDALGLEPVFDPR